MGRRSLALAWAELQLLSERSTKMFARSR